MKNYKIYLAGPITGQDLDQAKSWREDVKHLLSDVGLSGFSPMRGKSYHSKEEKNEPGFTDRSMSSINGIYTRDYNDVKTADAILVNFLECGDSVSIGTVMEIAWAKSLQIPTVIVMGKDNIHDHGMLTFGTIIVDNLEDGIDAIKQIILN